MYCTPESVLYAVNNYVVHIVYIETFIDKHQNCVGIHNLYRSCVYLAFPSEQPRRTFDPAGPNRLAMPLDLPTFATDFESSLLASYPSFENVFQRFYRRYDRRTRSGGYRQYTIVRSIIGFTQGGGTLERLTFSPSSSSSSSSFSSSFLSRLKADYAASLRDCLFIARMPGSTICRRFDNSLKCLPNALFNSISVFKAMFLADRFARLLNPLRDFFTLVHISHVRL